MTMTKRRGLHATSVRARLLDLLELFDSEWFIIRDLEREYSERFGPVKLTTLRRAVLREIAADDCEMQVRRRSDLVPGHIVLEVKWQVPVEEEV